MIFSIIFIVTFTITLLLFGIYSEYFLIWTLLGIPPMYLGLILWKFAIDIFGEGNVLGTLFGGLFTLIIMSVFYFIIGSITAKILQMLKKDRFSLWEAVIIAFIIIILITFLITFLALN